jgi:hypothetical protein
MLSLAKTEERIEELIKELLVEPLSQPGFVLTVHPGDLDDRAVGPRGISNVLVRFKSIDYEDKLSVNPHSGCFSQVNVVNFEIIVNNNSLRSHNDLYNLAEAIVRKIRGKYILLNSANESFLQSTAMVTKFEYLAFDTNKACNKINLVISAKFTDTYQNQSI